MTTVAEPGVGILGARGFLAPDQVGSLGGRQRLQRDGQHRGVQRRDAERPVTGPVAIVEEPHERTPGSSLLLGLDPPGQLLVGGAGVDDVQQVLSQHLELLGVVTRRLVEQVALGPRTILRPTDGGSASTAPATTFAWSRSSLPAVTAAWVCSYAASRRRASLTRPWAGPWGIVTAPRAGAGRRRPRVPDVVPVGLSQHLQRQALQADRPPEQLCDGLARVDPFELQERHPAGRQLVDDLVQPPREPVHAVGPIGHRRRAPLVHCCHGPTLRRTTDSYRTSDRPCAEAAGSRSAGRNGVRRRTRAASAPVPS